MSKHMTWTVPPSVCCGEKKAGGPIRGQTFWGFRFCCLVVCVKRETCKTETVLDFLGRVRCERCGFWILLILDFRTLSVLWCWSLKNWPRAGKTLSAAALLAGLLLFDPGLKLMVVRKENVQRMPLQNMWCIADLPIENRNNHIKQKSLLIGCGGNFLQECGQPYSPVSD